MLHRRKPNRLKGYAYSQPGSYFVTVCVKGWRICFGEVIGGNMHLSAYGEIAHSEWWAMVKRYPYVTCPEFIVMPNHVHGIIRIEPKREPARNGNEGGHGRSGNNGGSSKVGADHDRPVQSGLDGEGGADRDQPLQQAREEYKVKSLSSLVAAYKMRVSKRVRRMGLKEFRWQRSFYDHIIRSEKAFQAIREYIAQNPEKWEKDRYHPRNWGHE